jgi:hypothetical protein
MSTIREAIRLTPEVTPGTFDATGTATLIDIDNAQSYTVRKKPIRQTLRTAGTYNRRLAAFSNKYELTGNLTWNVRGSQAALIAGWCVAVANVLKTYTIDHMLVMEDTGATKVYARNLGMTVQQAQFTAGESDQWFKAALQLVGMSVATITGTDFPDPALTDFPTDNFLTFQSAAAGLTLHAATRLDIDSVAITIKNILDIKYFVGHSPQKIKWCGSDVDWTSKLSYSSAIPRTDFEAVTAVNGAVTFNNGTNTLAFQMNSKNFYANVEDSLDMSKVYLQDISMECNLDPAAATDLTLTAT